MKEFGQKNQKIFAAIICHNDELSLSSLDLIEVFFIWFAEISQILLEIYFIPILLIFMYLVALYQKKNWVINNLKSTQIWT